MKSNMLISFFAAIMLFFNSCSQAQNASSEEQAIETLKEFYKNYITENSKAPTNIKNIDALKKKYCTTGLLNKLEKEELDYDPILNAQDCDIKWLKTLSVTKDTSNTNMYIVSYIDAYSKRKNTIKLHVIKERERYKIDVIL